MYARSIEILDRALGPGHGACAAPLVNTGIAQLAANDTDAAMRTLKSAARVQEAAATAGNGHTDTAELADVAHNIGCAHHARGELVAALRMYARSLSHRLSGGDADAGAARDVAVAATYHNVAQVYQEQVRAAEALALHLKARRVREARLGCAHRDTTETYFHLGLVHAAMGQNAEAVSVLARAVKGRAASLGKRHPDTIVALELLRRARSCRPGTLIQL
jgi:tetratricopeptide (TPR) repeat protein